MTDNFSRGANTGDPFKYEPDHFICGEIEIYQIVGADDGEVIDEHEDLSVLVKYFHADPEYHEIIVKCKKNEYEFDPAIEDQMYDDGIRFDQVIIGSPTRSA